MHLLGVVIWWPLSSGRLIGSNIRLMEKIPFPTTWDVYNPVNNEISTTSLNWWVCRLPGATAGLRRIAGWMSWGGSHPQGDVKKMQRFIVFWWLNPAKCQFDIMNLPSFTGGFYIYLRWCFPDFFHLTVLVEVFSLRWGWFTTYH